MTQATQSLAVIIECHPGPAPACFPSLPAWRAWLTEAHASGEKVFRRVDVGRRRSKALGLDDQAGRTTRFEIRPVGQQGHCEDCTKGYRAAMQAEGRCFPVIAVSKPVSKPNRVLMALVNGLG